MGNRLILVILGSASLVMMIVMILETTLEETKDFKPNVTYLQKTLVKALKKIVGRDKEELKKIKSYEQFLIELKIKTLRSKTTEYKVI